MREQTLERIPTRFQLNCLLFFILAPPRPVTPEKFTIPHRCARFGPGGHLVQVLPNLPSTGQPALVDIYNMEVQFSILVKFL